MKNLSNYQNPELDKLLNSSSEEVKEHAKITVESIAPRNLPKVTEDNMKFYFEEFHLKYQLLIDKVNTELQFRSICHTVSENDQSTKKEVQALENKLTEAKGKRIPIDEQVKNTPEPTSDKRQKRARIYAYIICAFEGLFSIPVFEAWGINLIISVMLGILFAGVLAVFAEMFPKIIGLGKTVWQRRAIVAILVILTAILFKYLADVRVDYLNKAMESFNMHYSPWPFVCMSEILLIVAVSVCYFNFPTAKEKAELRDYQKLNQKKRDIDNEISTLDGQIKSVEQGNSEVKTDAGSILVYGSMKEEMIMNNAKSCYSFYKKHNLMHRTDGCKPDCFDDPYPFEFNTNFHSVKLLS